MNNYKDNFRSEVAVMTNNELINTYNDFSEYEKLFTQLNILKKELENRNLI
jgi:hypothetical protein